MTNSKNLFAPILVSLIFFASAFNLNANDDRSPYALMNKYLIKTIILINGTPFLVDLDEEGDVVRNYVMVADYFESLESHESMVSRMSTEYEAEMAHLQNSRLIIFPEDLALLNDTAVDNIRDVARLYSKGFLQNINITASHDDDNSDEALANYRVDAVYQLLTDFGVEEGDISADMKIYKSDVPNQFVKIDLLGMENDKLFIYHF